MCVIITSCLVTNNNSQFLFHRAESRSFHIYDRDNGKWLTVGSLKSSGWKTAAASLKIVPSEQEKLSPEFRQSDTISTVCHCFSLPNKLHWPAVCWQPERSCFFPHQTYFLARSPPDPHYFATNNAIISLQRKVVDVFQALQSLSCELKITLHRNLIFNTYGCFVSNCDNKVLSSLWFASVTNILSVREIAFQAICHDKLTV